MPEPTLLCVDDEHSILHSLRRLLRNEPYRLLTAASGAEALEMFEEANVQVLVSDYRMPGMTGTVLLHEVRRRYPETVRVMLSGYADVGAVMDAINEGEAYRFLPKPWNDDELKATIRKCFDRYDLVAGHTRELRKMSLQNDVLRQLNDELEETVAHRTHALELMQEIIEMLPLPVFGISDDGLVVLMNAAVGSLLPEDCPRPLGLPADMVLPLELVVAVQHCLDEQTTKTVRTSCYGHDFWAQVRALGGRDGSRGCLIIFEADTTPVSCAATPLKIHALPSSNKY